ncbi:DNA-binding protein [Flavobacterium rivuli WB 3.3-2 = DSM 21788]|uniref:DNA-binding protein n=1 Tax=Flavobacterium rivuli WB 3.3-2 = DSM 21788 TaxID=1121895 RepID=A0A0A2MC86_9FLAO|nr:helix-turn-helix transcriptional regulator [Flavobacterium rivuli]KGO85905.1 DNA-binding protein [Flavobacterium rivuli WB 3.3-2 = DSM 21788]
MRKYDAAELKLLNIQIGCVLRLARLQKYLSQEDLAALLESNSTMIGRVERAKNVSAWNKIFSISQELEVDYSSLFILMSKDQLLSIVDESLKFENKLTGEKAIYFDKLKAEIAKQYDLLNNGKFRTKT